ncbi:hypothetical protein ES703_72593 [subsurface metagenome]
MVRLPKLPDPEKLFSVIDKANEAIDKGFGVIDKVTDRIGGVTERIGSTEEKPATEETTTPVSTGTACLPCCRDHFSTTSSSLSEGIRFAREKGVKDPEVVRRIRIALDELNIMERIDLAPDETARLKTTSERDIANWAVKSSRQIRHDITAIKSVEAMEQAAANASAVAEEYIQRLWNLEEECPTCESVRENIKEFIEKRKRGVPHIY